MNRKWDACIAVRGQRTCAWRIVFCLLVITLLDGCATTRSYCLNAFQGKYQEVPQNKVLAYSMDKKRCYWGGGRKTLDEARDALLKHCKSIGADDCKIVAENNEFKTVTEIDVAGPLSAVAEAVPHFLAGYAGAAQSYASNTSGSLGRPTSGPNPEPFVEQKISDWAPISTAGNSVGNPLLHICIRDHECEDGDVLQVRLNGQVAMHRELTNAQACGIFPAQRGVNVIDVVAINGTGFKGACSHADANTGEISVGRVYFGSNGRPQGSLSQSQNWKLRKGAGSSSRIQLTVE